MCSSDLVDVAVRRLRLKIDDPFQLKLIHSVRGIGYRFDTQPGAASTLTP